MTEETRVFVLFQLSVFFWEAVARPQTIEEAHPATLKEWNSGVAVSARGSSNDLDSTRSRRPVPTLPVSSSAATRIASRNWLSIRNTVKFAATALAIGAPRILATGSSIA